jgi:2,4-dienoyl-CoA reductase-like NADH-dependent reductase (Old Yellow Enzyme family)
MSSARLSSDNVDVSPLAQPLHFEFSRKTAPNRFLKAAMTERLSSWDPENFEARGIPSKNLINVYKRWGEGGLGLILTGNIMIAYDQLEAPGNPIIPDDAPFSGERFEAFKELGTQSKKHGSLVVGQVSHPGRQTEARLQPNPVSASDVQLEGEVMGMKFAKPHSAVEGEIKRIIAGFTHAAEYLYKAGYDGIELHGAHGYLLAQFLSKTTNKRTDQYGGSLTNRSRIILEIAKSIREKLPTSTGFMVGIKLNSVEFQDGGFSAEECRELCSALENEGQFDFVELSGGTYEQLAFGHKRESTKKREAFFLEFAEAIVPGLKKTKTYITGGLRTVGAMVEALKTVDGVGFARPVCQEFHFCKDILDGKITGAIDQKLDQNNFGLTNVAAGSQIRQVGKDEEPIDLSKEENVLAVMQDMGSWGQKMQEDAASMNMYGYVDLQSAKSQPYGTVQA